MTAPAIIPYLNDHLAGSAAAREMLRRAAEGPDGAFYAALDQEIAEDQEALKALIDELGAEESLVKKAGAWITEKISRLKLTDLSDPLERLETLEILLLGVRGKLALWEALAQPELDHLPSPHEVGRLIARAKDQALRIEERRLEAFRVLASPEGSGRP